MPVRWAIAGPGRIARIMAAEFPQVEQARLVAVGARPEDHAEAFANGFGLELLGYEELFARDDIDAVYLSTPHAFHTDLALRAIAAGKAVLVEKSFTTRVEDALRIVDAARERGVFVMEGMWTRCLPAMVRLRELVAAGAIGQVRSIQGDLFAHRDFDPADRLFSAALGGGAVLDLGVYVLAFAVDLLGAPDRVQAVGGLMPNGVDGEVGMQLGYADGRFASLAVSFKAHGPGRMMVCGDRGWIDVPPRFHRMEELVLHRAGRSPERLSLPKVSAGYVHELRHASDCIARGMTESPLIPLADTLEVQRLMAAVIGQVAVPPRGRGVPSRRAD
jgi:predicted dehydrogenase